MHTNGTAPSHASLETRLLSLPRTLRLAARWVLWDESKTVKGRPTKRPQGSTLDPTNRLRFDDALRTELRREERRGAQKDQPPGGVGFEMTGRVRVKLVDGRHAYLIAFDMDGCRCPLSGAITAWAEAMVDGFARSYTEITPSGAGLRQWLLVRNPPKGIPKINLPHDAPPGVLKNPEIQTFGCGPAGYVTVTGNRLPGTGEIEIVDDLTAWMKSHGVTEVDHRSDATTLEQLFPATDTTPPSAEQIKARIDPQLIAGDWQALGVASASECWWRLTRATVKATNHDGRAAVAFLLQHTAFGDGTVDSKEPERYMRPDWVAKDVARVIEKANEQSAAEVFDAHPLPDDWAPPEPPAPRGRLHNPVILRSKLNRFEFLVEGTVPMRGLVQFFGDPKSGKSTAAVSLALHIAKGAPDWFGRKLPEGPGRVVYISGEGTIGLLARFAAGAEHLKISQEHLGARIRVSSASGRFTDPKDVKAWCDEIEAYRDEPGPPLRAVYLDTQARNFGEGSENDEQDTRKFIDGIQYVADRFGVAVIVVHHTGHGNKDRARGSSSMNGALDASVRVSKSKDDVTIQPNFAKDFDPGQKVTARIEGRDVPGEGPEGLPAAVLVKGRGPGEVFEGDVDAEMSALLSAIERLEGRAVNQAQIATESGLSRKVVRSRLKRAAELQLTTVDGATGAKVKCYGVTKAGKDAKSYWPSPQGQCVEDLLS